MAENQGGGGAGQAMPLRPAWTDLLEAYCNFDTARIRNAAKQPELKQLGLLLAYLSVEDASYAKITLDAARALLAENRECYRVHDFISGMGGVQSQHVTTLAGMKVFSDTFFNRLTACADLPAGVVKVLQDQAPEQDVYRALIDSGRSSQAAPGLSWAVLGRLALETRFVQVCRRLQFMHYKWAVPTGAYVAEALPLIADHPCSNFVRAFAIDRKRDKEAYRKLLQNMTPAGYEFCHAILLTSLGEADLALRRKASSLLLFRKDAIYGDYAYFLNIVDGDKNMAGYAHTLLEISPHAVVAKACLIRTDRDYADTIGVAQEVGCQHPRLLFDLGQYYQKKKQFEATERCWKAALAVSPTGCSSSPWPTITRRRARWTSGWKRCRLSSRKKIPVWDTHRCR